MLMVASGTAGIEPAKVASLAPLALTRNWPGQSLPITYLPNNLYIM